MTIFVKTVFFTEIIRAISAEDYLFFRLSASKTTYLFSASKMNCLWVNSVEDDLRLGYQRRR